MAPTQWLFPVFAIFAFAVATSCLFLPETVNRPLPSNLEELKLAKKETPSVLSFRGYKKKMAHEAVDSYGTVASLPPNRAEPKEPPTSRRQTIGENAGNTV